MIKGLLLAVFVYSSSFPSLASDHIKYVIGDMTVERLLSQYPSFQTEYDRYQVDDQLDLSGLLDMEVVILFGTWCHDSKREVPRILRILETVGVSTDQISLIGVDVKKREPNSRENTFHLTNPPTFIFFYKGKEAGRIIESPLTSVEVDLRNIVVKK